MSGSGDPQPHINDALHRQAVAGIDFLSVIDGYNIEENQPAVSNPLPLKPLPARELWNSVPGAAGVIDVLEGRVRITHQLFESQGEEIVQIQLQNVMAISDNTYVGFGFAADVMNGLVITCAPQMSNASDNSMATATCHRWRGFGTNLYPLHEETDAGAWFLTETVGNGTHVNYTLSGRFAEVVSNDALLSSSLRAICAVGQSAPDTGTPLIHQARDRAAFQIDELLASNGATSNGPKVVSVQTSSSQLSTLSVYTAFAAVFSFVFVFKC
jgi:hypothetical protein